MIMIIHTTRPTQLPHLRRIPAQTRQIQHPTLILLLQRLDSERLRPGFECRVGNRVLEHLVVLLEGHAVVGDVLPGVVHVDVQLGAGEELEAR